MADRPELTFDEAEALWRACAANPGPMRLEDAFEQAVEDRGFAEHSLSSHQHALIDRKCTTELVELSRAVLASGAEFPTNWLPALANALIDEGKLDEAEPVVRELLGQLESYKSEMLETAMRYHLARGDASSVTLLYHAGKRWFTSFPTSKAQNRQHGKPPGDLGAQFFRWLESWVGASHWDVAKTDQIGHWLVWFDTLGNEHCAPYVAAFEAERDRRRALYDKLERARREDMPAIAAEIRQFPGDPDFLAPLAQNIRARNHEVAYDLLMHVITSERRQHYRYPSGQRVECVVMLVHEATTALPERIAEAYAIEQGYARVGNPAIPYGLACCAARLGHTDDAVRYLAKALRVWPDLEQIRSDSDLASLHGDPRWDVAFTRELERRARKQQKKLGNAAPPELPRRKKPAKKPTGEASH
ncbi:MAG TPA: hypothetical protein VFQ53_25510 [Kofleriaceae bacterium]|nr:hypothetical protein [Kofleriaceae bacterium]